MDVERSVRLVFGPLASQAVRYMYRWLLPCTMYYVLIHTYVHMDICTYVGTYCTRSTEYVHSINVIGPKGFEAFLPPWGAAPPHGHAPG